jgi:exodeoxyribonuclease VII small subunit
MAKTEPKAIGKLTYEEAFSELEGIVIALESGEKPLEEALSLFERGQGLTRRCAQLLDEAELKVTKLSGEKLEPFEESE